MVKGTLTDSRVQELDASFRLMSGTCRVHRALFPARLPKLHSDNTTSVSPVARSLQITRNYPAEIIPHGHFEDLEMVRNNVSNAPVYTYAIASTIRFVLGFEEIFLFLVRVFLLLFLFARLSFSL